MATKPEEKKKDLVIIPLLFLGGGLVWWLTRKQGPPPLPPVPIPLTAGYSTASNNNRKLVIDSTGRLWAAFAKVAGGVQQVFVAVSLDNGRTWKEEQVTSNTGGVNVTPALAIDSEDMLHLVSQENAGLNRLSHRSLDIRGYFRDSGIVWSDATDLGAGSNPALAIDSKNVLHLAFTGSDSGGWPRAFYRSCFAGVWSSPLEVFADSNGIANAALEIDSKDDVHYVCRTGYSVYTRIWYRKKMAGVWGYPSQVSPSRSMNPSLVIDRNDNAWVCYERIYSEFIDYGAATVRERLADGTWLPETEILRIPNNSQSGLNMAADRNNVLTLVWAGPGFDPEPNASKIIISQNTGSGWSTPVSLYDEPFFGVGHPILTWAQRPSRCTPRTGFALIFDGGGQIFYFPGDIRW